MRASIERLPGREIPSGQLLRALLGLGLALGGLAALGLALLLGIYGFFRVSDSIAPGVAVGQLPVGGLLMTDAADRLDQAWNQDLVLTAVDTSEAGRTWQVSPGEFGLRVEAVESARLAYAYGRQSGLIPDLFDLVTGFTNRWQIAPVVEFDPVRARAALDRRWPVCWGMN